MPEDLSTLLLTCESEPIHLCGSIQPHGFLIGINRNLSTVEYVSQNVSEFLEISAENLIGMKHSAVEPLLEGLEFMTSFKSGTLDVLEVQSVEGGRVKSGMLGEQSDLLASLKQISGAGDLEELFSTLASVIREISGYDRVMVYQFADDWTGTVVGESLSPGSYESFMQLRFPAEDIPRQARELYRLNAIRYIPDVDFQPVPLVSARPESELDLSLSALRSVSPVHLEYLRNMEVGASMSMSIIIEDKLWGLVACHNRNSSYLSPQVRQICTTLTSLCAEFISLRTRAARDSRQADARALQLDLFELFSKSNDLHLAFEQNGSRALELVPARCVVLFDARETLAQGNVPNRKDLSAVVDFVQAQHDKGLLLTSELKELMPGASNFQSVEFGGLLAFKLSPTSWIFWLRSEIVSEINWAGEPVKDAGIVMSACIHVVRSKRWKEQVTGKSLDWSDSDVHSAAIFADYLRRPDRI